MPFQPDGAEIQTGLLNREARFERVFVDPGQRQLPCGAAGGAPGGAWYGPVGGAWYGPLGGAWYGPVGGAWNGARSFTCTSGPGISLMQEFIGLAYYAEIPSVFFDVQRTGPSTGSSTGCSVPSPSTLESRGLGGAFLRYWLGSSMTFGRCLGCRGGKP